ncbi:DUF6415 family natural product biosynthesis protein [Streptomyces sp. NBC_01614]|uniref:DUF6415 family natural product biosynthesis protein n=1 Tax=Streptomyces sp. NBC_00180 TaxID=2903632 RepID=A0AAU1I0Q6_9ACTN
MANAAWSADMPTDATYLPTSAGPGSADPPDISTMRASVRQLLGPDDAPDAPPPNAGELDTLTLTLRGHLALIIPEVERAAGPRPKDTSTFCALGCIGEARGKLRHTPGATLQSRVAHARCLARVLHALCDHYERLAIKGETREQTALRRLGEHSVKCPACRTLDDEGANANLPCAEGERMYDEYRQARRAKASPLGHP